MLLAIDDGFNDKKLLNTPCPHCRVRGKFKKHGFYWRNLIRWNSCFPFESKIKILRVRCTTCKTTHALLPAHIIPYSLYSLEFYATLLAEKLEASQTIEAMCKRFCISVRMVYRITYFYEQVRALLGFSLSSSDVIEALNKISSYTHTRKKFVDRSLLLLGRSPFTHATLPNVASQRTLKKSGFT